MEPLRPGDPPEIGGYRLLARLGEGGMGEVFLARTRSGRPLALKTVHRDLAEEPDFAERFAREIRTSDRVRSPWTVSVVDYSPPGAAPQWLATEYVAAPSLGEWVRRHGPLPADALRSLARELAAALGAVHEAGVVHRDLKPGNVLLGPERPYLIDFGIARAAHDPRRTRTGAVVGTPGFLAPEQATGVHVAAPADVFSLAAVLVHAATGHGPFDGAGETGLPQLLYRIVHDEPRTEGVPEDLAPLLLACLAKDPADRPTPARLRDLLGPAEEPWAHLLPATLTAETGRRAAELRTLLDAPDGSPEHPDPSLTPPPTPAAADPRSRPDALPPGRAATPPGSFGPAPAAAGPYGPGPHASGAAQAPPHPTPLPAFPGTPAPTSGDPTATPAAGRVRSRRNLLLAAAAGCAVLATTGALLLPHLTDRTGDKDPGAGRTGGATPRADRTPSAASGTPAAATPTALPAAWTGNWSGTGPGTPEADGITRARTRDFEVTVTFRAGSVGELVGRQVSSLREIGSGRDLGCTEALELRQFRGNTAVLAAVTSHPTDTRATFTCPSGNLYVVTRTGPDRLTLESEGAQSAGAPPTLDRDRP
ncbi:protein kinase [Streptomyces sp. NPDC097619]|uniref:serine/threonine-protein kinase n=1 Tax=Streptomyces sp. NPDC097619 TaxID=3157228 RepID=UPI00331E58DD